MLLFQVGDFYEFFGSDARRASQLLNLALTKKSKQANELEEMCGFPLTSLDAYVEKLVMHHGIKVAICNQVEVSNITLSSHSMLHQ
jgi:DNA mismatch repair protein MutS